MSYDHNIRILIEDFESEDEFDRKDDLGFLTELDEHDRHMIDQLSIAHALLVQ